MIMFSSPLTLWVLRFRCSLSREKASYGHITKQGNKWIRYIVVEAVGHTIRHEGESEIARMYERIKARKGASVAKVACARKPVKVVWFMLMRGEPYRYSDSRFIEKEKRRWRESRQRARGAAM